MTRQAPQFGKSTDHNEKEVIDHLRACGCMVVQIKLPVDLLVGIPESGGGDKPYREAKWLLCEVKNGNKGTLTETQERTRMHAQNKGLPFYVLRTLADCSRMIEAESA